MDCFTPVSATTECSVAPSKRSLADDECARLLEPLILPAERGGLRREVERPGSHDCGHARPVARVASGVSLPEALAAREASSLRLLGFNGVTTARWSVSITSFMSDAASRRNLIASPTAAIIDSQRFEERVKRGASIDPNATMLERPSRVRNAHILVDAARSSAARRRPSSLI